MYSTDLLPVSRLTKSALICEYILNGEELILLRHTKSQATHAHNLLTHSRPDKTLAQPLSSIVQCTQENDYEWHEQ